MKLMLVEWWDSHSGRGWRAVSDINENAEPLVCTSVGFLTHETKDTIVLVPHITGLDGLVVPQGCGDITIPKAAIRRKQTLRR